jgi:uncharacterized protein DUF3313
MKTKVRIMLVLVIGLTLTITTGIAGEKPEMHQTGFLTDYSLLKEDPEGLVQWKYFKDGANFGAYDKIIIDHVTFFFKEDADYKGIHPNELTELAQNLHKAFLETLARAYSFTDKPGPGTMRVRLAITDLVPGKPGAGVMTTVVPFGLAASFIKKAVTGSHIGMAQISGEAEMVDSQTGEILAAAIDNKIGQKHKLNKSFTKWGQVESIFNDWAENFSKRLDKHSGRK